MKVMHAGVSVVSPFVSLEPLLSRGERALELERVLNKAGGLFRGLLGRLADIVARHKPFII